MVLAVDIARVWLSVFAARVQNDLLADESWASAHMANYCVMLKLLICKQDIF